MRGLIDTLTPWFSDWGLLILFLATFIESSLVVASLFPGESVLLLGGFFASPNALLDGSPPPLELPSVILVAFAGAILGDLVGYLIGRAAGRGIVRRVGRFILIPERRLPVLERYFERYGGRAIMLGRFAPFLRSVRTFVAGTAQMPFWRFFFPDVVATAAWATGIASTGFLLGESWHVADRYLGAGGIIVFVVLVGLFLLTWRHMRARLERELDQAYQGQPGLPGEDGSMEQPPMPRSVEE